MTDDLCLVIHPLYWNALVEPVRTKLREMFARVVVLDPKLEPSGNIHIFLDADVPGNLS